MNSEERTEHTEFLEESIARFNAIVNRSFDQLESTVSTLNRDLRTIKQSLESEIDDGSN